MPRLAFVSYAREDAAAVAAVVERLEQLGYESWLDRALRGGQSWWEEILDHLRRCDVVVVLLSDAAIRSRACAREREYAAALHKPIIPLRIAPLSIPLPRDLVPVHVVDYTGGGPEPGRDLARALTGLPAATPLPEPLPAPPPVPLSYLVALAETAGADAPLGRAEQLGVLNDLEPGLRAADPEERRAAFAVLAVLEARPDLMADTARRIGHLRTENPAIPPAETVPQEPAGSPTQEVPAAQEVPAPQEVPATREVPATQEVPPTQEVPATKEASATREVPATQESSATQETPATPLPGPTLEEDRRNGRRRAVVLVALGVALLLGLGVGAAVWGARDRGGAQEAGDRTGGTTDPTTPTPSTTPTTAPQGPVRVSVDSTTVWTPTGVSCTPGAVLEITATGTILHNKDEESSRVGPDGTDVEWFRQFNVPGLPDANTASLIGGLDGQDPFFVGSDLAYACEASGELFLGVNDFEPGLANNSGSFDVTVVRVEP